MAATEEDKTAIALFLAIFGSFLANVVARVVFYEPSQPAQETAGQETQSGNSDDDKDIIFAI